MNIALVHDWLTVMAGAEKVLLQMKEVFPEADIYTSVYNPERAKPFNKYDVKTTYLQKFSFFRNHREALIPFTPQAFESLDLSSYDLVISNCSFPSKGVITKPETLHICFCHTPTRYLWEPELDSRAKTGFFSGLRQRTAHNLRIWDRVAAERPDYYLANSQTVQARIKKYYHRDSTLIYPPVDISRFQADKSVEIGDYFLFVSRLVDYKRADIVVAAFNQLKIPLKIIGAGSEAKKLKTMAGPNIEFLGHMNDDDLTKAYRGAKAFIFAAEEDFGIVPVEAMACGRPVITFSKGGGAESVIKGITGEYFDQQTPEAVIKAVKNFDPAAYDESVIRKRAEEFSEEKFKDSFSKTIARLVKEFNQPK